jgi:gamma-glutamylcyclotransferase (GGCT)/AIG2-like uncharacterized protein YtfP
MTHSGAEFLCEAKIETKQFVMRDLKSYPALQLVDNEAGDTIHGELYVVPSNGVKVLDQAEGYPDLYQRMTVNVSAQGATMKALVYYMDTTYAPYLTEQLVVESGKWNPYTNSAEYSGYDYSDSIDNTDYSDECPACGYWLLDGKCNECISANSCNDFSDVAEMKETPKATDFTVEEGIYIVGQYGEYFGPYESIEEACGKIGNVAVALGVDTKVLTIGFRVFRNDVDATGMADIDAFTEKV